MQQNTIETVYNSLPGSDEESHYVIPFQRDDWYSQNYCAHNEKSPRSYDTEIKLNNESFSYYKMDDDAPQKLVKNDDYNDDYNDTIQFSGCCVILLFWIWVCFWVF